MKANRKLSQNFLVNNNTIAKIADYVSHNCHQPIVEIGPGYGSVTSELIARKHFIHAIEIDSYLCDNLEDKFFEDIALYNSDVLKFDFNELFEMLSKPCRVFGSLPYHITSDILLRLIQYRANIESQLVLVQKEYAQRIVQGTSRLSIILSVCYDMQMLLEVDRMDFRPVPKVDSMFMRMAPKKISLTDKELSTLSTITRLSFGQRRKKLKSSLLPSFPQLPEKYFEKRADELTTEEYVELIYL